MAEKTRSVEFTSRALLYQPKNFHVEAKFHTTIDGLPGTDIIEQYIGVALHNYCHKELGQLEATLKILDFLIGDERKKIAILAKTNPQAAQAAQTNVKKKIAAVEQEFGIAAKRIKAALPKVAGDVWKQQQAENVEYRNFKIKVGVVASAKILVSVVAAGGLIAASVVTGGTTAAIAVGAIGAGISVLAGAGTALTDAGKSEVTVRKNLEAAMETLKKEVAKANLQALTGTSKLTKVKEFFKSSPAKKVESLMDDHKKQIIGVRQKADVVHNGVLKLIDDQDVVIKQIKAAEAKKERVDPKLKEALEKLEKHVDLILKTTESKLDAMANAVTLHATAKKALEEAKAGNLDGVVRLEKALSLIGPFDFTDVANAISSIGSLLGMLKV